MVNYEWRSAIANPIVQARLDKRPDLLNLGPNVTTYIW